MRCFHVLIRRVGQVVNLRGIVNPAVGSVGGTASPAQVDNLPHTEC